MAARVGDYLKQDPLKIRFTSSNPQNSQPKSIIKRALNQSVADITGTNYYSAHPNVIVYYELLDISIVELETKKSLKVIWTGVHNKEEVGVVLPRRGRSSHHRRRTPSCCPRRALSATYLTT
jgi:ubiquitin carboxyl-terminal hydrolase 7